MDENCKHLISHINRLQGQLEAVKKELVRGDSASCGKASRTLLSASRSFEGLRSSFISMFLEDRFLQKRTLSPVQHKELADLLTVIKG